MSLPRLSLTPLLNSAFLNPEIKAKCIAESRKRILNNDVTRLFDEFPELLSQNELESLTSQYIHIAKQIDPKNIDQDFCLTSINDTRPLVDFLKKLINISYHNLFDKNGKVHNELCDLLLWDSELLNKIDSVKLIKAYFSSSFSSITHPFQLSSHQVQVNAISFYVSTYKHTLIVEKFKSLKIPYDPCHDKDLRYDPTLYLEKNTPKLTNNEKAAISVGVTSLIGVGIFALGWAIHQATQRNSSTDFIPNPKR